MSERKEMVRKLDIMIDKVVGIVGCTDDEAHAVISIVNDVASQRGDEKIVEALNKSRMQYKKLEDGINQILEGLPLTMSIGVGKTIVNDLRKLETNEI